MKALILSLLSLFLVLTVNAQSVSFTLKNNTVSSIPLIIPNVMNPNLSPFSSSGVTLDVGQKIFFKHRGRKYLLIEVSEEQRDQKVAVEKLIKERKRELKLKNWAD